MVASHFFKFSQLSPQNSFEGGSRKEATKENFPVLRGMSLYKLLLYSKAIREPHWHANADELGYCLSGKILVSLYGNRNVKETFLINAGEAFFIPSGTLHALENVGEETSELVLQFSHETPEDFGLSSMFGMFSDAVLGNTWGVPSTLFAPLKRSVNPVFIAMRKDLPTIPKNANYSSSYRYGLEKSVPLISNVGGSARVARQDSWPILKRQALYSLELTTQGMREPHWHPETAELGFVQKGKGRMSVLSPSGAIDTYEMDAGDLYFIPKAYPHHIENLTEDPLKILIFFDQGMPRDIGLSASVKSYSDGVLAAILNGPEKLFESLPTYYEDLFIVKKLNHLD